MPRHVLLIDCQTTGASPARGALLEVGWVWCRRGERLRADELRSRLLQLPEGETLPPRIRGLTGIAPEDLHQAAAPEVVWRELAQELAGEAVPTVIHYARFERAFLRDWHARVAPEIDFPFDIVCTHEIARRLLPELPRRSLRALAGYFGLALPTLRRSREHLQATARVWQELCRALEQERGIRTWQSLKEWLAENKPRGRTSFVYPLSRETRLAAPSEPGIYRFLRSDGSIMYVGKATDLKRRINSYFQKRKGMPERTLEMLSQARDLNFQMTSTALEAALLESDEIKEHRPAYNIALQAAERRLCFCSAEFEGRAPATPGPKLYGPFASAQPIAGLRALTDLLTGAKAGPITIAQALGLPEAFGPDGKVFAAGFLAFCNAHSELRGRPSWARLQQVGAALWRARQVDADDPAAENDADQEGAAETPFVWDASHVQQGLAAALCNAAHQTRRALWLCRLSESVVSFSEREGARRVLLIVAGNIIEHMTLGAGEAVPHPQTWRRSRAQRQATFDLAGYDRLRILTTELRRLVNEGAPLELRLRPGSSLMRPALKAMLAWL